MNKLLFITHDTSRTGAPLVLLQFLNWLKSNQANLEFDVIGLEGGVLETDFKKVCHTYYSYRELIKTKPLKLRQRLLLKLGLFKRTNPKMIFLQKLANSNYNVVYANTIITIPLATDIIKISPKTKLIAHVHELNVIIKHRLPNFTYYLKNIHHIIVPSHLVQQNLVFNWNVSKQGISVVYECTKVKDFKATNKSKNKFIVGGSGQAHWRKGHDVFIQVARYIVTQHPECDINFVWVGSISKIEKDIVDEDLRKLGLVDRVIFTGEVEEVSNYYSDFDVFIMPSREDPFPLVCIEVGMLGKPIICFEGATGTQEIMGEEGGFVVPYLNIERMAEKVIDYYNHRTLIEKHGDFNKTAFSKFTPEIVCPQLLKVVETVFCSGLN
jgi:glycosyltransferase involved in cell wall biosynthesis